MTQQTGDLALTDLVAWAQEHLGVLTEEACAAVLERLPLYRTGDVVSQAELRRSVGQNLRFLIEALAGADDAPLDLRIPQETGRRRARASAPLPEVLQAYRISFGTLWDALLEQARLGPGTVTASLLTAASRLWQFTDEHALALIEAYRAATAEMLVAQQQRRSALVEALLTGQAGSQGGPWEAAALLGLPPNAPIVVVAAETHGLAEESLPGVEGRLATRGIASGWRLTPALQLGIVAVPGDDLAELLEVLRHLAVARTGVSPTVHSVSDTPRALQLARAALAGLPVGQAAVSLFDPSPLAALIARDPAEGDRLARVVLGSVLALPDEDRALLLETLHVYLDHAGSAEQAAGALHCHANTVRYRLRRLTELTGRSLADPYGLAELAAASYAVRVRSDPTGARRRPAAD